MSDWAIRAEGLSKRYRIGAIQQRQRTLRETVASSVSRPLRRLASVLRGRGARQTASETLWALRQVSFEVQRGQTVGIIGRNGAGKTTLLKILSRITPPTEGTAAIRGRVGSLLEVGTGFHPELTGRENIYLNGAILGMRQGELDAKLDEIVAFAEVERFIDTPVKHYSSGMYLRLAFSVAAHLEPEILLVDEVLAVGDVSFQRKCLGKMDEVAHLGRTVFFVSHNLEAIQRLCSRCLLIQEGRLAADGEPSEVIASYLRQGTNTAGARYVAQDPAPRDSTVLLEAGVVDGGGSPREDLRFGEPFGIDMLWEHRSSGVHCTYALRVLDSRDRLVFAANSIGEAWPPPAAGRRRVICRFDHNVLVPGEYRVSIGAYQRPNTTLHFARQCLALVVLEVPYLEGHSFNVVGDPLIAPRSSWQLE